MLSNRPLIRHGRLFFNQMTDNYQTIPGVFQATGQDLELWIRQCLVRQHWLPYGFSIKREDRDETKKRFRLYFTGRFFSPEYPPAESLWGAAEVIEWSSGVTEIFSMWIYSPPDWEVKFYSEKKTTQAILDERFAWLQELSKEIIEKFDKLDQTAVQMPPDDLNKNDTMQSLPPINAEGLKKVKELSLQGLPVKVIALRASISESTVKRYRKILGVQRRR